MSLIGLVVRIPPITNMKCYNNANTENANNYFNTFSLLISSGVFFSSLQDWIKLSITSPTEIGADAGSPQSSII